MPATKLAADVTEEYRARLERLADLLRREAKSSWRLLRWNDLRGTFEIVVRRLEPLTRQAQLDAVRLTTAYLGAFLSAELGTEVLPPVAVRETYVGTSYNGLPLRESLRSPLVTVLTANKRGMPDPLGLGLRAMLANLDLDVKDAARRVLADGIVRDDRITGWQRAVRGTCGACMAAAGEPHRPDAPLHIHPGCQCISEPIVEAPEPHPSQPIAPGTPSQPPPNTVPRLTGAEIFAQMTPQEQDDALGPEAAEAVRTGRVKLEDLVKIEGRGDGRRGFLVQRPVDDL